MQLEIKPTTDFLTDVVTTAIESGIDYWADISNYRWGSERGPYQLDGRKRYAIADAFVVDTGETHRVTLKAAAIGIERLLAGAIADISPHIIREILLAVVEEDAGLIDAEIGDVIIQAGLLGEYVYA